MGLITDNAGTTGNLLSGFRRTTIRDVWMDFRLNKYSGTWSHTGGGLGCSPFFFRKSSEAGWGEAEWFFRSFIPGGIRAET